MYKTYACRPMQILEITNMSYFNSHANFARKTKTIYTIYGAGVDKNCNNVVHVVQPIFNGEFIFIFFLLKPA